MLYVDNKFGIGQEVYIVQKAREDSICPACNGDGHKMIDGHKFSCVDCYGTGRLHGKKKIYKVKGKDKIHRISIHVYIENGEVKTVIKYKFQNATEFTDKRLFAAEEEAIAECDKLNSEILDKVQVTDCKNEVITELPVS